MKIPPPLKKSSYKTIRGQAESIVKSKGASISQEQAKNLDSLRYELGVHQVELELQNEELRQSQLELADAHDRYMELFEFAPVTYLVLNEAGKIINANLRAEEVFSMPRSQILGKGLEEYVAKASQDTLYFHRKSLFVSCDKQVCELTLNGEKENAKIVRVESTPMPSYAHKTILNHTVLVDITREKHAEAALNKLNLSLEREVLQRTHEIATSRDFLSSILETASDAIITINPRGTMLSANPATRSMFGYAIKKLEGANISMLLPKPFFDQGDNYISSVFQNERSQFISGMSEVIGKHKNGSRFPISISISSLRKTSGFTLIIRNMSERIDAEKEAMRCIDEERRRISRDIHDSVSQDIVGASLKARSTSNKLKKLGDPNWSTFDSFSSSLDAVAKNIRLIISDLAMFDFENNRICDLIHLLVSSYKEYCEIEIIEDVFEGTVIEDAIISAQVLKIIQEALNNAVKHSKATKIKIHIGPHDTGTLLSITDNGRGFDSTCLSSSPTSGCCGFGFISMRHRARVIGGNLEVVSRKGQGTAIHLVF